MVSQVLGSFPAGARLAPERAYALSARVVAQDGTWRVAVEDAAAAFEKDGSTEALTAALARVAKLNLAAVADLFDLLMFKYADGWVNTPTIGDGVGYPAWWLKDVNYTRGPPPL